MIQVVHESRNVIGFETGREALCRAVADSGFALFGAGRCCAGRCAEAAVAGRCCAGRCGAAASVAGGDWDVARLVGC